MNQEKELSLRNILLGKPKNPLNPKVFQQISLVAFLVWVGLGADGLSSSAYGPEEAYPALGQHFYLALLLAIMTAVTVFFSGKLVFEEESVFTRLLHNHTPYTLQRKLQFAGREMMILPSRVFATKQNSSQQAA